MSEGVKLLISADDQASRVVDNVAENVDTKIKRIKEVGGKAKASTEFIGTLANSLGGTELGSYAGQLGQLTEKVSAFSEVSKAGAGGALAFKAGLAGVVAVGAFKVGQVLGDIVFETKRWREELEAASIASEQLFAKTSKLADIKFNRELEGIELLRDPDAQIAETKRLAAAIEKEIQGVQANIARTKALEEDSNYAWNATPAERKLDRESIAQGEQQLAALRERRLAIELLSDARKKENDSLREQNALADKNAAQISTLENEVQLLRAAKDQRAAIEALQKSGGDPEAAKRIEVLLTEKDLILKKEEADKIAVAERQKAAEKVIADAKKIEDLKKSETERLREQRIELERGSEAAKQYALEQQGIDSATAKRLAAEEESIKKLREEKERKIEAADPIAATQGRLLTRGPSSDIWQKQLEEQKRMAETLMSIKANTANRGGSVKFAVVGS